MAQIIRKAVIPAAGIDTQFLPATKSMPAAMLSVLDRPVIQFAVDEARAAGIEDIVVVVGSTGQILQAYFQRSFELETNLEYRGQTAALSDLRQTLPNSGHINFVHQQEPLGLGHAIWCARSFIGNEPFAVLLPDMVCLGGARGAVGRLLDAYELNPLGYYIGVHEVAGERASAYGIAELGAQSSSITKLVEKPRPSRGRKLAVSGRYLLQPEIIGQLADQTKGAGGEIQLTDSIEAIRAGGQSVSAVHLGGQVFDCSSKLGLIEFRNEHIRQRTDLGGHSPIGGLYPGIAASHATIVALRRLVLDEIERRNANTPNDDKQEEYRAETEILESISDALAKTDATMSDLAEGNTTPEQARKTLSSVLDALGEEFSSVSSKAIELAVKIPVAMAALGGLGIVGANMGAATPVVLTVLFGKEVVEMVKGLIK